MSELLEVRGLTVDYQTRKAGRRVTTRVIEDLNLHVGQGEVVGIVGESGSGKSTLANALFGLVDRVEGSARFDGIELVGLKGSARRPVQRRMQMVFQNPLLSLSPRRTIESQIDEPLRTHTDLDLVARREEIGRLLDQLDLSRAIAERFPHELSGGQAQRVVLARALALKPELIVFDEPTSALDVSVQAGVLNLLRRLRSEHDLTYLFITHDLGVVRHLADRIAVMRQGEIVELNRTLELFAEPEHPYTRSLLEASIDPVAP